MKYKVEERDATFVVVDAQGERVGKKAYQCVGLAFTRREHAEHFAKLMNFAAELKE